MRRTTKEERDLFIATLAAHPRKSHNPKPAAAKHKTPAKRRMSAAADVVCPEHKDASGARRTTRDERALFEAALRGAAPKKAPAQAKSSRRPPSPKPARTPPGLDGNTARKLTRGELAPSAKLDLHGLTEAAAHRALAAFLLAAHHRGDRLVLVVTGKGAADKPRGVLKRMVPRWLDEAPLAKLIADKRWSHIRHGGEGALYVYLRKPKRPS